MLKLEDVTEIINEKITDEALKAEIGVGLLEKNLPDPDTSEIDALNICFLIFSTARAFRFQFGPERINKFIYGGDPGPGPEPEVKEELEVEEAVRIEDPYEELYGGKE